MQYRVIVGRFTTIRYCSRIHGVVCHHHLQNDTTQPKLLKNVCAMKFYDQYINRVCKYAKASRINSA